MLHKAWNSKGEMLYCFPRSSIKFQGHTVQNITNFYRNWAFPDYWPVAAFKSLRFALFNLFFNNLVVHLIYSMSASMNIQSALFILVAWCLISPKMLITHPFIFSCLRVDKNMARHSMYHWLMTQPQVITNQSYAWLAVNNKIDFK